MGQQNSYLNVSRTTGALDSFIADLGADIVYEKSIGSTRFLKTAKCRHRNGYLVVKVFVKSDPGLSLRNYHRKLKAERDAVADISNIHCYQAFTETDKAGYLIRQWIASNLYDRISTRPFLTIIEKKWITFQILNAMRDARNRKTFHGDVKTENILVTSWNWVYITDFASYKPTYLPLDDPSDFSFYFDTSGRRTCYLAPERFYTDEGNPKISAKKSKLLMAEEDARKDGKLTEAMDCFSVGCVIAELFMEAPLFTLSQLYKYRAGEVNVDAQLATLEDSGMREIVEQMIHLDPAARPTFDSTLHTLRGTVLPECFYSYFHNYISSLNELSPAVYQSPLSNSTSNQAQPTSIASPISPSAGRGLAPTNMHSGPSSTASGGDPVLDPLPSDSDYRVERIWSEFETIEGFLMVEGLEDDVTNPVKIEYTSGASARHPLQEIFPVELFLPNRENKRGSVRAASQDGPALLILAVLTANVRNCALPSSKAKALDVFLALSPHLTDEAKLDRMVPYIVELLHDDGALVRAAALRTLIQVLMLVSVITPSNVAIFPEYILPNLKHLVTDPEPSVRCVYAQSIVHLADTAVRYLEMWQALKAHGLYNAAADGQEYEQAHLEVSYESSMQDLQSTIENALSTLLIDPSSIVKRAVLHNVSSLCIFLGRQKTNDVLLSHMITYLNDKDWALRQAFFESIVDVAACAGGRSLEEYILPLMIQALSDVEETVVAQVLVALTSLCELGLFQKMRIWELMSATLCFLYHPNSWIRQGAVAFLVAATKTLPPSDTWCILYPSLRSYLRSDVAEIDEQSLLMAMKPVLPRQILDGAVHWAMRADTASFWRTQRRAAAKTESPRESVITARKTGNLMARNKSEEDEAQIVKLQALGMTSNEETKLIAMRDYILKLANASASFTARGNQLEADIATLKSIDTVELRKLQVVPQTVFLKPQSTDAIGSPRTTRTMSLRSPNSELSLRSPSIPTRRLSRVSSTDQASAPFEEVRRRLASINGSTSSLNLAASPREPKIPLIPTPYSGPNLSTLERPQSPTESVVSTSNSAAFKPTNLLYTGGTDAQKAAPAVGSSKANALGVLDAHSRILPDAEMSGRSTSSGSPLPVRPSHPSRLSTMPISSYDGKEAGINAVIENLYLHSSREYQDDFGPKVHDGPIRRRNPVRQSLIPRDGSPRKLEATLVAHLASHNDCITGLAVSPDHLFFVSCSDDKTVKVWDTARLERNVTSKPRHTYGQHHARVKAVCVLESVHCFASAAEDGSLHVVRVDVSQSGTLPKYGKLQVIREHRLENPGEYITCMYHYNTDSASNLVYTTTHSRIVVLDLRTMDILQVMENPRHLGLITTLCVDRKRSWIIVGTSAGVLNMWDRRFGLLLRSWHVGTTNSGRLARVHQCVVHPTKGKGKWVMVTSDLSDFVSSTQTLVEVWDIEKATLIERFVTRKAESKDEPLEDPAPTTSVEAETSISSAIEALVRSRQAPEESRNPQALGPTQLATSTPAPTVRAVAAGVDFGGHTFASRADNRDATGSQSQLRRGFMVSGSDDRKITLWDLAKLERTTVLSGTDSTIECPAYSISSQPTLTTHVETWPTSANSARLSNRPTQRMSLITHDQQNLLKAHRDVITALACIDSPFRGGIVSGDRSGVVKVWRVDAAD
ncbi:hypothetical protein BDV98DRAFT_525538, partial [Pterulicium gracile]